MPTKTKMEKKCRSCLTSSPNLRYYSLLTIFPEFARKSLSVLDLLSSVTSSKVELLENLPSFICFHCFKLIKSAYSFIIAFKHSQKILLEENIQINSFEQEDDKEQFLDLNEENIIIITEDNYVNDNEEQIDKTNSQFIKVEFIDSEEETTCNVPHSNFNADHSDKEINEMKEEFDDLEENDDLEETYDNVDEISDEMDYLEEDSEYLGKENDLEEDIENLEEDNENLEEDNDNLENEINISQESQEEDIESIKSEDIAFDDEADHEIVEMESIIIKQGSPKEETPKVKIPQQGKFKCEFCENSYTANRSMVAHIRRKHPELVEEYQEKVVKDRENRDVKVKKRGEEPPVYKCDICDKIFSAKKFFTDHNKNFHHPDWRKKYKCNVCNEPFKTRNAVNYHNLSVHIGKKYTCKLCDKKFITHSTLSQHIFNVHERKTPEKYLCSICGRGFKYNTALKYHMGKNHTNQRDFVCGYCGAAFILLGELRCHERNHTGERPFSCPYCEKTFKRSTEKIKHEKTHLGIYPYKCDYCEGTRVFTSSYNKKIHWLQHRGSLECEVCGSGFASQEILKFHYSHKHKIRDV